MADKTADIERIREEIRRRLARRRKGVVVVDDDGERIRHLNAGAYVETTADGGERAYEQVHPHSRTAYVEALSEVRREGLDGEVAEVLARKMLASGVDAKTLIEYATRGAVRAKWGRLHRENQARRLAGLGPRADELASWLRETR